MKYRKNFNNFINKILSIETFEKMINSTEKLYI